MPLLKETGSVNLKDINKGQKTAFIIDFLNNSTESLAGTLYFNDPSKFIAGSTTTGYTRNTTDLSNLLFKDTDPDLYDPKRKLVDSVEAYTIAPSANSKISLAVNWNLIRNDFLSLIVRANYTGAVFTVELFNDIAVPANKASFTVTGTNVTDEGFTDQFSTIIPVRATNFTTTGAIDLATIKAITITQTNATLTNRITPIAIYNANNYSNFVGTYFSLKACCPEVEALVQSLETAEKFCGTAKVSEEVTSAKFDLEFSMVEESSAYYSLVSSVPVQILPAKYHKVLDGFGVGQTVTEIPTAGIINIGANLELKTINLDCSSLIYFDFTPDIAVSVTLRDSLLGENFYSYNKTNGNLYFSSQNKAKFPEIWQYDTLNFIINDFNPFALGYKTRTNLQILDDQNKLTIWKLRQVQYKFPEMSREDIGYKSVFKGVVTYAKKGDVRRLKQI